jgi:hypothetical protein
MLSQDPPQDPKVMAKPQLRTTNLQGLGRFMRRESSYWRTTVYKAAPVSDKSEVEIRRSEIDQHRTYPVPLQAGSDLFSVVVSISGFRLDAGITTVCEVTADVKLAAWVAGPLPGN